MIVILSVYDEKIKNNNVIVHITVYFIIFQVIQTFWRKKLAKKCDLKKEMIFYHGNNTNTKQWALCVVTCHCGGK